MAFTDAKDMDRLWVPTTVDLYAPGCSDIEKQQYVEEYWVLVDSIVSLWGVSLDNALWTTTIVFPFYLQSYRHVSLNGPEFADTVGKVLAIQGL